MAENVKVRAETPIFGIAWGQEATLERTPAVAAAIEEGRLTLLGGAGSGFLRGEALEEALREAGLSTSGTADQKRARLAGWRDRPQSYTVAEGANTVTSEQAAVGSVVESNVVQPEDPSESAERRG
jgi:hypothetical protein